jgi:hypothetical protein
MTLAWMLHPAVQYAVLSLMVALCLFLFVNLKAEVRGQQARQESKDQETAAHLAALGCLLEELRSEVRETEERARLLVPPTPPQSGLNLNKRSQALKLYRRGDSPHQIAAALALPVSEVELLLKVHQMVLDQVG